MDKKKILFICAHNSARSQMAEAFIKQLAGDRFEAESAGLEAGVLNPLAVEVMKEKGIDISHNKTKSVFDFYKQGKRYNYVITVCDASQSERCPIFPGAEQNLNWDFPDPSVLTGTNEEKMKNIRKIRDQIEEKIKEWLNNEK